MLANRGVSNVCRQRAGSYEGGLHPWRRSQLAGEALRVETLSPARWLLRGRAALAKRDSLAIFEVSVSVHVEEARRFK